MAQTGARVHYAHKHNFKLELAGSAYASFQEVSGLEYQYEVVEYREGGDHSVTRKFRGHARAGNITLRRGVVAGPANDNELLAWLKAAHSASPGPSRLDGSVVVLDDAGREVRRWNFTRAWPVRWEGPDLDTTSRRDIAITELEFAVETIDVVSEGGGGGG